MSNHDTPNQTGFLALDFSSAASDKEKELIIPKFETNETIILDFYVRLNEQNDIRISDYVFSNIHKLLDYGINKNEAALQILVNGKFLSCLLQLIVDNRADFSSDEYRYKMNRICYDYIKEDHNVFIQNLLLNIVFNINKKIATTLMGFNLTVEQASKLVAARYSTASDLRINYKRITRMIQSMPYSIMTEQNIINIFDKTCTESVTDLFIAVMYDSYTTFLSSEEEEVYSTVNLALLDILESLPIDGINKVITSYMRIQPMMEKRPRFALKSVSVGDYPRINQVIDILESQRIYVY